MKKQEIKKNSKRPVKRKVPTKKVTKKRRRFNFFKFLRNIIILFVVILIIHAIISLLTPKPVAAKKTVVPPQNKMSATQNTQATTTVKATAPATQATIPTTEYKTKQAKLVSSIFRFNQNLYMAINSNNVVNLYPDSQNAVNALNSNLSTYATKIGPTMVQTDSSFISELMLKNNIYINNVIAYNKAALAKNPNKATLAKLHKPVLDSYNAVNKLLNDNSNLFK